MEKKTCKDCVGGSSRPAPYPGPRCATHHREKKKAAKEAAWANRIYKTYGITGEQYYELYRAQGSRCYICHRATGGSRRLAVDHDHVSGAVRGLLCSPCNKVLGHFRDSADAFERGSKYLREPPAQRLFGRLTKP